MYYIGWSTRHTRTVHTLSRHKTFIGHATYSNKCGFSQGCIKIGTLVVTRAMLVHLKNCRFIIIIFIIEANAGLAAVPKCGPLADLLPANWLTLTAFWSLSISKFEYTSVATRHLQEPRFCMVHLCIAHKNFQLPPIAARKNCGPRCCSTLSTAPFLDAALDFPL